MDISKLAHQLRDPLSTIMLWEQLMRTTDDPEVRARGLDAIRDCARAQSEVIDELARAVRRPARASRS
ncbi:MAG: histidine kinase dimerization/phospho-acceptor domain-containing protein [Acidobacteriota bacterium]